MSKFVQIRSGLRPAVGAVAAFVLALQLMLSGFAAPHVATSDSSDAFVICYGAGDGPAGAADESDKAPAARAPCVLCTLAHASCAVVPPDYIIAYFNVAADAVLGFESDERMPTFESPTSRYQRGPPSDHPIG